MTQTESILKLSAAVDERRRVDVEIRDLLDSAFHSLPSRIEVGDHSEEEWEPPQGIVRKIMPKDAGGECCDVWNAHYYYGRFSPSDAQLIYNIVKQSTFKEVAA